MSDLISRQAAQAKIKSICDEYRLSYEDGERKAATGGSAYALGHAFDDLPPVAPQESVLDKIRAEIEDMNAPDYGFEGFEDFYMCQSEVLQIIDKYKAEVRNK